MYDGETGLKEGQELENVYGKAGRWWWRWRGVQNPVRGEKTMDGYGQDEKGRREESRQRVEIEKARVDVRGWRYEQSRDVL